MKISKDTLRKIIIQEIRISIAQQSPVEEELGSAQTYVTAKTTSYIASHEATMGQISEDDGEKDFDEDKEGYREKREEEREERDETDPSHPNYNLEEGTFTLTNSWLKTLVQEEMDDWFYSDKETMEDDRRRDLKKDRKAEEDYEKKSKEKKKIEEEKEEFLQDIKSTGEWTDYTIAQLKKKKAALMKKKSRTKPEQKKVSQIDFAINAKEGDYKKKK